MPYELVSRAIVQDDHQRILLVKHYPDRPWTLPGGHLEAGETFQDACVRELAEEFGMEIELLPKPLSCDREEILALTPPVAMFANTFMTGKRGPRKTYEAIFLARKVSGGEQVQVEEIHASQWFTRDQIALMDTEIYSQLREGILAFT